MASGLAPSAPPPPVNGPPTAYAPPTAYGPPAAHGQPVAAPAPPPTAYGQPVAAPAPVVMPVVQPGLVQPAARNVIAVTPQCLPPGSILVREKYCGPVTHAVAIGGFFFVTCLSCCIYACPIDERDVYLAPDGRKYDALGALILS
eukprot:CAMPEP_0198504468 /NCGR_PEP_ID=MMETSP1462-20131121/10514_1 /TAXON_ID=1333877 /ORGANISM="Brandtodinium nutriculum, Strain RCC3387" /LENGTH=144 /DNA_ID=CAMNT_0044233639 /DNA_START=1 /DNA_END=435 /DNA_ORIENTATION=-